MCSGRRRPTAALASDLSRLDTLDGSWFVWSGHKLPATVVDTRAAPPTSRTPPRGDRRAEGAHNNGGLYKSNVVVPALDPDAEPTQLGVEGASGVSATWVS